TDATDGTTDATDGTTDATDGTTDATDGTTDATDGTTDATDGTTDATDSTDATDATDGSDGTDTCLGSCETESRECGTSSCGEVCGTCDPTETCSPEGACECVPVCPELTCSDDGCGAMCACPGGYDCESGVCDKACEPLCGDGFECQAGSCVQVAPVVLFNLNMSNAKTPNYPTAAGNLASKPLTAVVGGVEVVRASLFINTSGLDQYYGIWGNSTLTGLSKELRVVAEATGSTTARLTPDIATAIPVDRFEVIMHVSRAHQPNSGTNKGSAYFYLYPDAAESTYHRVGLGFQNVSGDGQVESVLHVASGIGKNDANAQLAPTIAIDDGLLCPGDYNSCPGFGIVIRFQVVGGTFKIKYWSAASPEPSAWTATETWNPPAALHHWAFGLYGGSPTNGDLGGAALGSLMIRSLPAGGTDALLGAAYPASQEAPLP
ncbi:MAG: hypothetical protein IV100_31865, partial [Myxococcales bacterium]|nr:hypothetical protein [Myxococcales bacterium]